MPHRHTHPIRSTDLDAAQIECAVGPEFACQLCLWWLATAAASPAASGRQRRDARFLCAWLGAFDGSVDDLLDISPWMAATTLYALRVAPRELRRSPAFHAAMNSLEFQFRLAGIPESVDRHTRPDTVPSS